MNQMNCTSLLLGLAEVDAHLEVLRPSWGGFGARAWSGCSSVYSSFRRENVRSATSCCRITFDTGIPISTCFRTTTICLIDYRLLRRATLPSHRTVCRRSLMLASTRNPNVAHVGRARQWWSAEVPALRRRLHQGVGCHRRRSLNHLTVRGTCAWPGGRLPQVSPRGSALIRVRSFSVRCLGVAVTFRTRAAPAHV